MAWIRACGGSSSKKLVLVEKGVIKFPFDTKVYAYGPNHSAVTDNWQYSSEKYLYKNYLGSIDKSCGYSTDRTIDFSKYKNLVVVARAKNDQEFQTYIADVSEITESLYVVASMLTDSYPSTQLKIVVSRTKDNYGASTVKEIFFGRILGNSITSNYASIMDMYLE